MGEEKSKFPSFGEVTSMAGKLFSDVKKSVCEIIIDFKAKRPDSSAKAESSDTKKASATDSTSKDTKASAEDHKENDKSDEA